MIVAGCFYRKKVLSLPQSPSSQVRDTTVWTAPPFSNFEQCFFQLAPLLSAKDFARLKADFEQAKSALQAVQTQLEKNPAALALAPWLRDLWMASYLQDPNPLYINNYVKRLTCSYPGTVPQVAGQLIARMLQIRQLILEDKLPVDPLNSQICLDQIMKYAFACRVPGADQDVLVPTIGSHYICVLIGGAIFKLPVLYPVDPAQVADQLQGLLDQVSRDATGALRSDYGLMTQLSRQERYAVRERLLAVPENVTVLQALENALFWVRIDSDSDATDDAFLKRMLAGDPRHSNRQAALTLVVSTGKVGAQVEHAALDGANARHLFGLLCDGSMLTSDSVLPTLQESAVPLRLRTDGVQGSIPEWERRCEEADQRLRVQTVTITDSRIRELRSHKYSEDGVMQVAFVLAMAKALQLKPPVDHLPKVYESVDMRHKQGRTNGLTSVTPPALAFVNQVLQGDLHPDEVLKAALKAQADGVRMCKLGNGLLRHLFGLSRTAYQMKSSGQESLAAVAAAEQAIRFLEGDYFRPLGHDAVSTSNCSSPFTPAFAFHPTVAPGSAEPGVGNGYVIRGDQVCAAVSMYEGHADFGRRFAQELPGAVTLILDLLVGGKRVTVSA